MLAFTARLLGNTPAICRKNYVHPGVIDAFHAGAFRPALRTSQTAGRRARVEQEVIRLPTARGASETGVRHSAAR